MNKLLCGGLALSIVCSMSSCSLQRLIQRKKTTPNVTSDSVAVNAAQPVRWANLPAPDTISASPDTAGTMKQLIAMVTPIWNAKLDYRTLTGKAKVHFEGPEESQDFTANIRVKKDTAIWVDITALGGMVHAARVLITNDSLFMINYLQKEFSKLPLSQVARILPTQVDFMSLQNLVTGEPLRKGDITSVAELGTSWLIRVADSSYLQTLNCSKADSSIQVDQVNTREPNGPQALMKFDRFEYTCGRRIAMSRVINIQNMQDKFLLEMDFQSIEFDKDIEIPFVIPGKFTNK